MDFWPTMFWPLMMVSVVVTLFFVGLASALQREGDDQAVDDTRARSDLLPSAGGDQRVVDR